MQTWQAAWVGLSAEADGILAAGQVLAGSDKSEADSHLTEAMGTIRAQALKFMAAVVKWAQDFAAQLPPGTESVANRLAADAVRFGKATGFVVTKGCLVSVACARAELARLLEDADIAIRTTAERAFEHLQRTIDCHEDYHARWSQAFAQGEVACEALGAVHLLGHHIWAFKADAKNQRTDLVLGSPMSQAEIDRVLRMGACLVLTEWKVVRDPSERDAQIAAAVTQLEAYSSEALHGVELHSVRYCVLVSKRELLDMPGPRDVGSHEIRFINIALTRDVPSRRKPTS